MIYNSNFVEFIRTAVTTTRLRKTGKVPVLRMRFFTFIISLSHSHFTVKPSQIGVVIW